MQAVYGKVARLCSTLCMLFVCMLFRILVLRCIGIAVHAVKGTGVRLCSTRCMLFRILVLRCRHRCVDTGIGVKRRLSAGCRFYKLGGEGASLTRKRGGLIGSKCAYQIGVCVCVCVQSSMEPLAQSAQILVSQLGSQCHWIYLLASTSHICTHTRTHTHTQTHTRTHTTCAGTCCKVSEENRQEEESMWATHLS